MSTRKKWIYGIVITALIAVIAVSASRVLPFWLNAKKDEGKLNAVHEMIRETVSQEEQEDGVLFTKEAMAQLKAINNDVVGYMAYDDGFVSEPVVQGTDNSYYLEHWIDGDTTKFGTFFIDSQNQMTDTNLTMYGHNVFQMTGTEKMTPMVSLLDSQEAFEAHDAFRIWYEDKEVTYRIAAIWYYDIAEDSDFDFRQRNFTDEELKEYTEYIEARNLIVPSESIQPGDRFLTIQTCRDESSESTVRIIFTCREVAVTDYE